MKTKLFLSSLVFMFLPSAYSQTTYYSKSAGNLNTAATWGTNPDGSGTAPANFITAGCTYIITNTTVTFSGNLTVSGTGSGLQVGNGTAINFTMSAHTIVAPITIVGSSSLTIAGATVTNSTVSISGSGGLAISGTSYPKLGTLAVGSTVFYNDAAAQNVTDAAYYNLTLDGGAFTKTLLSTASTTISGALTINSGVTFKLSTVADTLYLNGTIGGDGTGLITSNTSNLSIGGTGALGTIILTDAATTTLNSLTLNRAGLGTITLGSATTNTLSVKTFTHNQGILQLNGNQLTLSGTGNITFPASAANGSISGNSTSNLSITTATTTISNNLYMTAGANTLNNFTLNSSGQTLTLGNDLTVLGAYVQTKGIVDLNGHTLTLDGDVTFTSLAANGSITGSTAGSTLIVAGSSIANKLFVTASSPTLDNLTLNSSGNTLTLGSTFAVSSAFIQTAGILALGGQTLTLSGTVTFPAASTSGYITGTTTSGLVINASTITNPLFMDQTTPGTTNALKIFTLNSPGQTLTLGSNLQIPATGTFSQTNGIINLNGTTLSMGGTTIFPAAYSNGSMTGSSTSNLSMTSASITNNLFMTSGAQTLNNLTLTATTATVTLTLGNDLTVGGNYDHTKGIVNLNGNTLTLNGAVTVPTTAANGTTTGSTISNLIINATSIAGKLFMTAGSQTLNNFTLNSGTATTLTLGNSLTVSGAFNHTSGVLSLGANNLLTLSGTATFPTSASNGVILGSATSALALNATSYTNSLFMDQVTVGTSNELKTFTLNSPSATLTLGNNLVIATGGSYTHTNGTISLNGTTLTLNGSITFPAAISNGSFTGSSTSCILVGGAIAGTITNNLLMDQTSSSTNSLSNLTLNRNTQTITLGNSLNVIDSISPTKGTIAGGGNITLIADQVNVGHAGRIAKVGGTITGNITSQVYHNPPPGNTTNWTLMGSAGVTNANFGQWNSSFQITCPSGCSSSTAGGTAFSSITTYNESTDLFPAITGTTSTIVPGVGYWVYLGTTSPGTTSAAELITVTGTPQTGNFTWPALTNTSGGPGVSDGDNGYNLISNPYPSPISWLKVYHDALNSAAFSSFPSLSNMYMYSSILGNYVSYNAASGISNPSYAQGTTSVCDKIPAGGGFYVTVGPGTGSATLKVSEGDKVSSGSDSSFIFRLAHPSSVQSTASSAIPYFSLIATGTGNVSSEAAVAFSANATLGNDAYDTQALPWNNILQITSTTAGQTKNYAVNALPALPQNYTVPVKILSGTTAQYTLAPTFLNNIAAGACLNLHDNYTNTDYNLRSGPISLTINDTELTVARFVLTITTSPLSVTGNSQNPTCANSGNGYMVANASGSAPWNYYWKDINNNIIRTSLNASTDDTLKNANAGSYHVDINTSGTCNNGTVDYILQGTISPTALFTTPASTVTLNADTVDVSFTNTSTSANTYLWNFGDGTLASGTNATHQYSSAGAYVVSLTAVNAQCGDTSVYTQTIVVDSASYTTGIKTFAANENNMLISRDAAGYYVQFNYQDKTNAVISVQNLLGEKVVADINQEGVSTNKTYIPMGNTENNVLIISVITTAGEKTFRKVINQ